MKQLLLIFATALFLFINVAQAGRESGGSSPFTIDMDAIAAIAKNRTIWPNYHGEVVSVEKVGMSSAGVKTFRFTTIEMIGRKNEHGTTIAWDPVKTVFDVDVVWSDSGPTPGAGGYEVKDVRGVTPAVPARTSCQNLFLGGN